MCRIILKSLQRIENGNQEWHLNEKWQTSCQRGNVVFPVKLLHFNRQLRSVVLIFFLKRRYLWLNFLHALHGFNPVSYTHLDVYKRQSQTSNSRFSKLLLLYYSKSAGPSELLAGCLRGLLLSSASSEATSTIVGSFPPVSYTHLDVYKRQGEYDA